MYLDIVQKVLNDRQIAYAIADHDLRVIQVGGKASVLLADDNKTILGRSLPELVPELAGSEAILAGILAGEQPSLHLEHINRSALDDKDQDIRYLTLIILPYSGNDAQIALLVLLTDTTEQGAYAQMLMQQRNELHLLRRDLAGANEQLDFLLRHYVPLEVTDALLKQRALPQLGGELRQISALFADLQGYILIARQLSPPQAMEVVNEYLNVAGDAIAEAGGTITQFMGGTVVALFNAPNDQPDHAWRAVQAGMAIQKAMAAHQSDAGANLPPLCFGVGIQSGPAVVGNTGARWRHDYSAIGDTVNVASRICRVAQGQDVLIGPATYEQVRERVRVTRLAPMHLKGKSRPLTIFRVNALDQE